MLVHPTRDALRPTLGRQQQPARLALQLWKLPDGTTHEVDLGQRGGLRAMVALRRLEAQLLGESPGETWTEIVAVDRVLKQLEEISERQARVVECLSFAGLSIVDTSEALDISPATVKRDWSAARVWLYAALQSDVPT